MESKLYCLPLAWGDHSEKDEIGVFFSTDTFIVSYLFTKDDSVLHNDKNEHFLFQKSRADTYYIILFRPFHTASLQAQQL